MKYPTIPLLQSRKPAGGFTLVEMMFVVGLGSLLLAVLGTLTVYGARSFAAMGNYVNLDDKSRNGLDLMTKEIRGATRVLDARTTPTGKSLTLFNADQAATIKFTWDSTAGTILFEKTGQTTRTNLTGCDTWNFSLYTRAATVSATNILYNSATKISDCKLINMSWKCSRSIIGQKVNTESIQSAQIVLRNKPND